jgi:hypothetical protein
MTSARPRFPNHSVGTFCTRYCGSKPRPASGLPNFASSITVGRLRRAAERSSGLGVKARAPGGP